MLTPREIDIIGLIVAGMSNREISDELVLSVNSVKTYIRTAYRKMGVARRTQAMRWALDHGIGFHPGYPRRLTRCREFSTRSSTDC